MSSGNEKCVVCGKVAYPMEKLNAEGKAYHKSCFRCSSGGCQLKLGTYAALDGKLFCKPHFKQLFGSHGNYSTGFGKLTPQQQHNQKKIGSDGQEGTENTEDTETNETEQTEQTEQNEQSEAIQEEPVEEQPAN